MRRSLSVLGVTVLMALAVGLSFGRRADHGGAIEPSPTAGHRPALPSIPVDTATAPEPRSPVPASRPAFAAVVSEIDATLADRMSSSWTPGCPVALTDLRYIELTHWGFGGRVLSGELVVHADWADAVVDVFSSLFDQHFPIERMSLVSDFAGDDHASMAANNTSAFNCRTVAGSGRWSEHAYGRAIDINPVQNPFVSGDSVEPPLGAPYVDRSRPEPGMIRDGDAVVSAFSAIGWEWGGSWRSPRDWQHFSATGS